MKHIAVVLGLMVPAGSAAAETYLPVQDRDRFMSLVEGKLLRNRLYGIRLNVLNTGDIQGSAIGWDITGTWDWRDGYFCRKMAWGDTEIAYNCQLVEVAGDKIRFTVDRGAGNAAAFRMQ